jgi:Spy/CpxP family protein refolding chaperone
MTTTTPRRGATAGLAALALIAAMATFAPAAFAHSDAPGDGSQGGEGRARPHPQLTDEQQACLEAAGVEKPAEGQPPTEEQRAAFREAAQQCGIPLPRGHRHLRLTDEQRACLEEAGVSKPEPGQRPTDEQREAFRAAAQECGINLPDRSNGPPPAPGDGSGNDENQSASVV